MNIGGNKIKGLVHRPNSYDSYETPKQNAVSWLSTRLLDHLKNWATGTTDYRICFELENGKILSTKVTKSLIDRYVSDKALSPEEKASIIEFLTYATDSDLSESSEGDLKVLTQLLSLSTKDLKFLRDFIDLKLNNFESIAHLLSEDNDILNKLNKLQPLYNAMEILTTIDSYPALLKERELLGKILGTGHEHNFYKNTVLELLGQNPELLKLDPNLLGKILNPYTNYISSLDNLSRFPALLQLDPKFLESIWRSDYLLLFGINPILSTMGPEVFNKIISIQYHHPIFQSFNNHPELLKLDPELLDKIFKTPWPADSLEAFAKHPQLIKLDYELLERILKLSNAHSILNLIVEYPELKDLEPDLMNKISTLPDLDGILKAIGKNKLLELLELQSGLIKTILSLPTAGVILEAIGVNFKILELKPDFVNKVLVLPNSDKVIRIIAEYPELLELIKPDLIDKILPSPNADKIFSAIAAHPEILDLNPELMNRIFFGPNSDRILNTLKIYSEGLKKTDILMNYVEIYESFSGQVGDNFESIVFPYLIRRSEQLASKSPGPFLNYSQFLYDVMLAKSKLPIRESDLSNEDWKALRQGLEAKVKTLFPGDEHKQKLLDALRWFDQMPNTRDAQLGLQVIRKRVASIVDYIKKQDVDPNAIGNDALVDEGIEIAKELVRILAEGGSGRRCPDAAAMALEEAEMFAMAFTKNPDSTLDYIMNVIVNAYKRNIIPAKFVDPNQFESVETQLYHLNLLNKLLGLESQTGSMLYEGVAIQTPLDEAMKVAYGEFSEEGLIGFAQDHPLMQAQFRTDPKALEEFEQLMHDPDHGLYTVMTYQGKDIIVEVYADEDPARYINNLQYLMAHAPSVDALKKLNDFIKLSGDLDNLYRDPEKAEKAKILSGLYNQLEKMMNNFKAEKTKMLLIEAGFLGLAEYADPAHAYFLQK